MNRFLITFLSINLLFGTLGNVYAQESGANFHSLNVKELQGNALAWNTPFAQAATTDVSKHTRTAMIAVTDASDAYALQGTHSLQSSPALQNTHSLQSSPALDKGLDKALDKALPPACTKMWIKFVNAALPMQLAGSSVTAGAQVRQEAGDDSNTSQQWEFLTVAASPTPVSSLTSGTAYYIRNVKSGLYLNATASNSVAVQNSLPASTAKFQWTVTLDAASGSYSIKTTAYGAAQYLGPGGASTSSSVIYNYADGSIDTHNSVFITPACSVPCGLTIPRLTTSGCYLVAGASKATVEVEVAWTNVHSSNITVTMGVQTRTIFPQKAIGIYMINNVVNPQVVAFEVPADNATGTVTAVFDNLVGCSATSGYTAPAPCGNLACSGTTLGGMVFNDYDANGLKNAVEATSGVEGITVTAFAKNGMTYTTTTDGYGKYVLNVPVANYPVRVEWTGLGGFGYGNGTVNSTNGKTSVQFVAAASCNVDLGVLQNGDYCQGNPKIVLPMYHTGDPAIAAVGSAAALYRYDKSLTGAPAPAAMDVLATVAQMGATWGVVYDRYRNKVYTAASVRRHAALGPLGIDGVYVTDLNAALPNASKLLKLSDYPGLSAGTIDSKTGRGLTGGFSSTSVDTSAWFAAGKRGLGAIDISEDGNSLWVVNLYQKELLKFNLANLAAAPTRYAIPNPACSGGAYRPWSVKVRGNAVYVGVVCDGNTSQSKSDLRAFIYQLTIATGVFAAAPIMQFPLTYPKATTGASEPQAGWYPWTDDMTKKVERIDNMEHPEPILSDMAFDIDGSMVLAFLDRTAMQGGWYNLGIDGGSTLYRSYSGGDILRAFYENGSYVLENNAKAGPATGAGANNNQGPGFGEFYADGRIGYHQEGALGGLALQPGSGQVLATTMDPGNYFTNGTTFFNNATGVGSNDYQVYQTANPNSNGTMSKASGLGDVDLMCGLPMYLEIGNYVWADADANGIQDPTEAGLSAVDVRLYSRTGTLVGLTTTSSTGEYYFNTSNVDTTGVNSSTGAANTAYTGMSANTRYYVVIGKSGTFSPANKVLTIASVGYTLTLPNNGQGANADANDSDASLASGVNAAFNGYPYISVLTGALGSVNHTYDFGFTNGTVGNYGWSDFNRNSINDDFPSGGAGINGLIIELWKETTPGSNSYALLRSTTTANDGSGNPGYYLFNVAETANYKVKFPTTYGSKVLTTQTATAGVDNNSDADIATGFSPAFAINVLSGGLAKDNMTIDAGFICPGGCATVTVLKN